MKTATLVDDTLRLQLGIVSILIPMPRWLGDGMIEYMSNPLIEGKICENFAHTFDPRILTNEGQRPAKAGPPVLFHGFDFAPGKRVCPEQAASQIDHGGISRTAPAFLPLLPKGGEGRSRCFQDQIPSPRPSPRSGGERESGQCQAVSQIGYNAGHSNIIAIFKYGFSFAASSSGRRLGFSFTPAQT